MKPVILAVEAETFSLDSIRTELLRRYGEEYEIVTFATGAEALAELERLTRTQSPVAVVLSGKDVTTHDGLGFLAECNRINPTAVRALVMAWGDRSVQPMIVRGFEEGHIQRWLGRPSMVRDEHFHWAIAELLMMWAVETQPPFPMVRIVGERWDTHAHEVRDLLTRNGIPFWFYEAGTPEATALLANMGVSSDALPVVIHGGDILIAPTHVEVADSLGVRIHPEGGTYDVVVVGAGPAGLAASVYAASEGLRTLMVEPRAMGGQAGTTSLIRNYLGFPSGITGARLASRAYEQAWLFGAELVYGNAAVEIRTEDTLRIVKLANGDDIRTRAIVVATGVDYRRLVAEGVEAFEGAGVYYGAAMAEARLLRGERAYVVGGGNSAGQAALYLAHYASHVTMLVRGSTLAESMSDYLVRDLEREPKIDIRLDVQVVGARGERQLEGLTLEGPSGKEDVDAAALFVLIGAEPRTDWLPAEIERDAWGYVLTGPDVALAARPPALLETSMPGVFAAGDVRHGSVKRVASAVGDGAIAVRLIHEYLADQSS